MRIGLVYQDRKKWPKFAWVHRALERTGHEVVRCRTIDDVRAADRECDLLLFEQRNAGLNERDLLSVDKSGRALWSQWWFDLIRRDDPIAEPGLQHLVRQFGDVMRKMDVVFVKDFWPEEYGEFGVAAIHLDQGCPSDLPACHHCEDPEFDVLFVGSATKHYSERVSALRILCNAGLRVAVAGDSGVYPREAVRLGWVDPLDLPAQFSRAAVVVHIDIRSDVPSYWSDSLWLKLGAGVCVVKRQITDDDHEDEPDWPCFMYAEPSGLLNLVCQLRLDVLLRRRMGEAARRWVMENHTYEHRVRELIQHVDNFKRRQAAADGSLQAV